VQPGTADLASTHTAAAESGDDLAAIIVCPMRHPQARFDDDESIRHVPR
jgi:hypothetical protein